MSAQERQRVAEHEAAHLVVATVTGGRGRAQIWQDSSSADGLEVWHGNTAVTKEGNAGATCMAGRLADSLTYVPNQSFRTYLANLPVSDVLCLEEIDEMCVDELFATLLDTQIALGHLIQHRDFFDWAVGQLVAVGVVTDEEAMNFVKGTLERAGASPQILAMFTTQDPSP
jgi:hypothetical protein